MLLAFAIISSPVTMYNKIMYSDKIRIAVEDNLGNQYFLYTNNEDYLTYLYGGDLKSYNGRKLIITQRSKIKYVIEVYNKYQSET